MKIPLKHKALALAVASAVAVAGSAAFAARPSDKGPPVGGETSNNLSYPALFAGTSAQTGVEGEYNLGAQFPDGMSFGCNKPETIGTTTYPNTSCVDDTATVVTPITAEACVALGGKCEGLPVERIYWQKNNSNTWQAGYFPASGDTPTTTVPAHYVDWGDNLEGRSWPVQVLRVETNTFADLSTFTTPMSLLRFDMWHVFGQGTNELWGARASDLVSPVPRVFPIWPYAVNYDNSSQKARLNITKLGYGAAPCPPTATGVSQVPDQFKSLVWDDTDRWQTANTWELYDQVYTAELNIKGSYVYGYNWNLRSNPVPTDVGKSGWWRLTFYDPDKSVDFGVWVPPTADKNTLAPPASIQTSEPMSSSLEAEAEEGETGLLLYVPQVDATNQLTYLDICIKQGVAGGGGGGGKKPR
jgi:hypothetical protein